MQQKIALFLTAGAHLVSIGFYKVWDGIGAKSCDFMRAGVRDPHFGVSVV